MKIIYGITKSNFGGAQRYVFDLAQAAKAAGHDVSVICGGSGVLVDKLNTAGIKVFNLRELGRDISTSADSNSFFKVLKILKAEKPDVFHLNSSKMGGLGTLAGRVVGIKQIIFTSHGWAFNEPRPVWQKIIIKFFVWVTLLLSHKIVCVSEKTREQVENLPFVSRKLVVIKNGVEEFDLLPREQARREMGVHDESFVVGTLAELHPIKGLDILLEAWSKFRKNHSGELIILGTGEMKEGLESFADMLNIHNTVSFRGYVEDARKYLSGFDVFCLPSRSENLPYAILEAGMAKLPVIASSVGGIPEIIDTGVSGILVEKENIEDLFSSLVLLADNADLRLRLGEGLREVVQKNFSREQMIRATLDEYAK